MNDLLKFISNSLKPFGYHVRPRKGLNFLHVPNLNRREHEENVYALFKAGNALNGAPLPGLDELMIIFRTCIRANRNIDAKPRITGAPMDENMRRCLNSLLKSIQLAQEKIPDCRISLRILDDRSDPQVLDDIKFMLEQAALPASYIQSTRETGQGASLYEQFQIAKDTKASMVYFIEDDYLHEPDAIYHLCRFYRDIAGKTGSHMILYPQEHPVMYDHHYPSYIVTGEDRHWRSIRNATHSFFTHTDVVRQYWKYFENTKFVGIRKKRRLGSEDRTTNKIFRHIPGFAPLKPVAIHLQFENTLPPLCDWKPLWEASKLEKKKTAAAKLLDRIIH